MALEKKGSPIVVPAIRVADLPALPDDITDSTGMRKWWNDFRQVLARLIQSRSDTTQTQPPQPSAPVVEQPAAQELKPVDWDSIINKPEKFPPEDHTHTTPWLQVEEPLYLSGVDPATNLATLGFHEQKAGHFLAGPLAGPAAKPVFRPLYGGDDSNLEGPGTIGGGDPGTYDDLNGTTGGGTPEGIIAVQARGGSWSLVGHAAYLGLEPTRRWRLRTFGGSLSCYSGTSTCEGMTLLGTVSQSGTQYVEDDGSVTNTAAWSPVAGTACGYSGDVRTITDAYGICGAGVGDAYCRVTAGTATTWQTTGRGVGGGCCTTDGVTYYAHSGVSTVSLSAEDLPPAAIGRMLATADWGEATTAIQTIPAVGITGVYREARYRTEHTAGDPAVTSPTLVGLSPWQRYQVTVTLESRPVDSAGAPTGDGSWSAAGTRQHYFVADLTGEGGIDWQIVEPTAGYETRIASTLVEAA